MIELKTALTDFSVNVVLPVIRKVQSFNRRVPRPVIAHAALPGNALVHGCWGVCFLAACVFVRFAVPWSALYDYVAKVTRSAPGIAAYLNPDQETDEAEAPKAHTPCLSLSQPSRARRARSAERPTTPGLAEQSERREKESQQKRRSKSRLASRRIGKKQPGLCVSYPYPEDSDSESPAPIQPPSEAGSNRSARACSKKLSARASDGSIDSTLASEVDEKMRSAHDALVNCTSVDAPKATRRRKKSSFGLLKEEIILNEPLNSEGVLEDEARPQDQAHDRSRRSADPGAKTQELLNAECVRHSSYARSTKAKRKRHETRSIKMQPGKSASWPHPENTFVSPPKSDRLRVEARSSCSHIPSRTAPGRPSSTGSSQSSQAIKTSARTKPPRPAASPLPASGEHPSPVRSSSAMQIVPGHPTSLGREQTTPSQDVVAEVRVTRTLSAPSTPLVCDVSAPALPTHAPRPQLQECDATCLEPVVAVSDEVESRDVRTDSKPTSQGQAAEGVASEPDNLAESIGTEPLPNVPDVEIQGMDRLLEDRQVAGLATSGDLESLVDPNESSRDATSSHCDNASNGVGLYKVLGSVDSLILTSDKLKGSGPLTQDSRCVNSDTKNIHLTALGEMSIPKFKKPLDVEDQKTVLKESSLEQFDNNSLFRQVRDHKILAVGPIDSMELITDKLKGTASLKKDPKCADSVAKNTHLSKLGETSKLRDKWRATPKLRKKKVTVEDLTTASKELNSERPENVSLLRKVRDPNILKHSAVVENTPRHRKRDTRVTGRWNATPKLKEI